MAFIVKTETTQPRSLIVKRNAIFKIFPDFWSNTSGNFWNLIYNPYQKTITNFNIGYAGGEVEVNWGESTSESILNNTDINHIFGITRSGISIFPKNGADIQSISCGTSSPLLSGTITISSFPNLIGFTCKSNGITNFSGIESCVNLRDLDLAYNSLTVFPSFNFTPLLEELRLEENLLSGSIPSLDNLTNLKNVRFQENKKITGSLPSLSLLTNLESFYAIGCNLRGLIPDLSQNTLLKDFRIDSQTISPKISGNIPSLSANTQLLQFFCHNNHLTGIIPSLSSNTLLRDFRCYDNKLTGFIPSLPNTLQNFRCQENQLTGAIPQLSNIPELSTFYCNNNRLTGFIPNFALNFSTPYNHYLEDFRCQENQLTGAIPQLSNYIVLADFYCNNNRLTGVIPNFASDNYDLINFYCNDNQLTGTIPHLYHITKFNCSNNRLTGVIPNFINPSLYYPLTDFYCSNNNLTGSIPSLNENTALKNFDCQFNQLSGSIPSLNANNLLENFYCNNNRLTGFAGGSVSNTLGNFQAQNNFLTFGVVNSILSSFVSASRATGTRILNLGGAGNAAPIGQGIADKAFLISPLGWTVTTN